MQISFEITEWNGKIPIHIQLLRDVSYDFVFEVPAMRKKQ